MYNVVVKRRVLNLLSLVSLLLFLAMIGLWIWSYTTDIGVLWQRSRRYDDLAISRGEVCYGVYLAITPDAALAAPLGWIADTERPPSGFMDIPKYNNGKGGWSFFYCNKLVRFGIANQSRCQYLIWLIPAWCPAVIFGALPIIRFARWKRRSRLRGIRMRHGQRLYCGYDMRATPGRCPECGAIVA